MGWQMLNPFEILGDISQVIFIHPQFFTKKTNKYPTILHNWSTRYIIFESSLLFPWYFICTTWVNIWWYINATLHIIMFQAPRALYVICNNVTKPKINIWGLYFIAHSSYIFVWSMPSISMFVGV